jgi:GWxTD domain-containing protein
MKFQKVIIKLFPIIAIIFFSTNKLFPEVPSANEALQTSFFMDVIAFKSDTSENSRLDVMLAIPFQSLSFIKSSSEEYVSKYEVFVTVYDFTGKTVFEKTISKISKAKTFQISQGVNSDFEMIFVPVFMDEGSYKIKIEISDLLSKVIYERNREIAVINYRKYPFAMSGAMLVSSVFESESKKSITPFLNDNISSLKGGFFAFFETYNQKEADSVDFVYQILENNKVLEQSEKVAKYIRNGTNQEYIKIALPENLKSGNFILKLIALSHTSDEAVSESNYLAVTQRTINYTTTFAGNIITDIDLSIKQLRYVATNEEMNYLSEGTNNAEKVKRFKQFWELLDPSPNTPRNEAYDEYFSRIEYANKNFKSYTQGWMTDMGMVYIIYGTPMQVDKRQDTYNPNRRYERWVYQGKEFIFVDPNGFGDFRLANGTSIVEKYDYNRNR